MAGTGESTISSCFGFQDYENDTVGKRTKRMQFW